MKRSPKAGSEIQLAGKTPPAMAGGIFQAEKPLGERLAMKMVFGLDRTE
jgi:hypothetical protein